MRRWIYACVCALCGAIGASADAAITGGNATGGDTFSLISPPANVGNNNQDTNGVLYAFDEKQHHVLTVALDVNITPGGGAQTIPVGTVVSSHYVFVDPISDTVGGTVSFSDDIIGIVEVDSDLDASAAELGAPGTTYSSPLLLGLESVDSVSISGPRQITLSFQASDPGDYVRVITVPEPGSAVLAGAAGLLLLRRKRGSK